MRTYRSPKSHTANLAEGRGRNISNYSANVPEAERIAAALAPRPKPTEEEIRTKAKKRITLRKFTWEEL